VTEVARTAADQPEKPDRAGDPGRAGPSGDRPRLLVVQTEPDAGLGRLEPGLGAAADLDLRRPDLGDRLPSTLADHAGLIVLGGTMGATDDDVVPWLPAARRLLAAGVESGRPTIGICLGAQLLAVATGGRVERGGPGLELGAVPIALLPTAADDALLGPVLGALGDRPLVAQFHQDAVTELPAGAVLLAHGETYPHQAFRLGERAWGLQYHPEVTGPDFALWLRDGHGSVQDAGLHAEQVAADYVVAEPRLAALADLHAAAIAAVLVG
jgi:GMP synthase-like glutamine amidotransferase